MATEGGLARYDGLSFETYRHDPNREGSISTDDVTALLVDKDGILWVGGWDGRINRYGHETGTFTQFNNSYVNSANLGGNRISTLFQDEQGRIWVGTEGNGINLFDPQTGSFKNFQLSQDPTSLNNYIWCIKAGHKGNLWLGTSDGVCSFNADSGESVHLDLDETFPWAGNAILGILLNKSDDMWLGVQNKGVYRLNLETLEGEWFKHDPQDPNSLVNNNVTTIHKDHRNVIWVGTRYGLSRYQDEIFGFINYLDENSGPAYPITRIFEDRTDVMWIGSRKGLFKLDRKPRKFGIYEHDPKKKQTLPSSYVSAVVTDANSNIWVGTDSGLSHINRINGEITNFFADPTRKKGLSNNEITALVYSDELKLWIGTRSGLNLLDENNFTRFYHNPKDDSSGPAGNEINCLMNDSSGNLWIGTQEGLSHYDGKEFHSWRNDQLTAQSLGQNKVTALCEGLPGIIWIGTRMRGLDRLDTIQNKITHFRNEPNTPNSLSNNSVVAIHEAMGFLWVGTESGLNRLNRISERTLSFHSYKRQDGLPSNLILGLADDGNNQLWISTDRGLSRLSITEEVFRNFDVFDGLQNNRFLPNSAFRGMDGELLFGGVGGLNVFVPRLVQDNPYLPNIVLTKVLVPTLSHENLANQRELLLSYQDNVINLEFAAMDFTMPEKNQYSFKLDGFQDWSEPQAHRTTAFTNLPSGSYTFSVKATNNDQLWSNSQDLLTIRVLPPLYQSNTAYVIYVLLLILTGWITWLLFRRRARAKAEFRRQRESERIRLEAGRAKKAFLANMSHDLRTPLTAIIGYSELVEEEANDMTPSPGLARIKSDLWKIKAAAYQQLGLVTNLLELSKLEAGQDDLYLTEFDVTKEVGDLVNSFRELIIPVGNEFRILIPEPLGTMRADRIKLLEILTNLLDNANKFTSNGVITLAVRKLVTIRETSKGKSEWIIFSVKDSGAGMEPGLADGLLMSLQDPGLQCPSHLKGLGLEICFRFCQLMGGTINVESQIGEGTKVTVRLPAWVSQTSSNSRPLSEDLNVRISNTL